MKTVRLNKESKSKLVRYPYFRPDYVHLLNISGNIAIVSINIPAEKYPLDLIAYYDYVAIDVLDFVDDFIYFILNTFITNQVKHIVFVHEQYNKIALVDSLFDTFVPKKVVDENSNEDEEFGTEAYMMFCRQMDNIFNSREGSKRCNVRSILDEFVNKFRNAYTVIRYEDFINKYYRIPKLINKSDVIMHSCSVDDILRRSE